MTKKKTELESSFVLLSNELLVLNAWKLYSIEISGLPPDGPRFRNVSNNNTVFLPYNHLFLHTK